MEYTILILILPLLSFLCLGLLGTKLRPFVSGCIGSIVLAAVAASGSVSRRTCTSTWASCSIRFR